MTSANKYEVSNTVAIEEALETKSLINASVLGLILRKSMDIIDPHDCSSVTRIIRWKT